MQIKVIFSFFRIKKFEWGHVHAYFPPKNKNLTPYKYSWKSNNPSLDIHHNQSDFYRNAALGENSSK